MADQEVLSLFPHHPADATNLPFKSGCYYITMILPDLHLHLHGTLRLEIMDEMLAASGDLYKIENKDGLFVELPDIPKATLSELINQQKVPVFPVSSYDSYFKLTNLNNSRWQFQQYFYFHTDSDGDPLHSFSTRANDLPAFIEINLHLKQANNFNLDQPAFTGAVFDDQQKEIGTFTMHWVSDFFRRFNLEIDALQDMDMPQTETTPIDWGEIFRGIGWEVNVVEDQSDRVGNPGAPWNNGELHAQMLNWRNRHRENGADEWWYYLLCIPTHENGHLGIMFDDPTFDGNKVAREGAAICAEKVLESAQGWPAPIAGKTLSELPPAYFRTALHELGHMMGLRHEPTPNTRLMNQTNVINFRSDQDTPAFPENISWVFAPKDEICLKHMPDIWVRPGGIGWNIDFEKNTAILNDREEADIDLEATAADSDDSLKALTLEVSHLSAVSQKDGSSISLKDLPLGVPVRIKVHLKLAEGADPIEVPASLSLKTGFINIEVQQLGRDKKPQSLQSGIYFEGAETGLILLNDKNRISHSYTLLHNKNGALFPTPGNYSIRVTLQWHNSSGREMRITGETKITIAQPQSREHKELAEKILNQPEVTQMIIFGGWHLEKGAEALQAATSNPKLSALFGAHYAITLSKCYSKRFFETKPDMDAACAYLKKYDYIVLNESEILQAAKIVDKAYKSPDYDSPEKEQTVQDIARLLDNYSRQQCDKGFCDERTREAVKALINTHIQKE